MRSFPRISPYFESFTLYFCALGTLHPRNKSLSYSMDVGEEALGKYLYGIFLESLVSDLSVSKETLDRMKWMLSSGSYTGEFLVSVLLTI